MVEDLLLLSRMDAGKLRLNLHTMDLTHLVEEWIDDLRAVPEAADLRIESDIPQQLQIAGETKYTALVVQNLLDNARKYNRRGGTIRISAREENRRGGAARGEYRPRHPSGGAALYFRAFPPRRRERRMSPGHGLGLNLARELVRLHGGELRLVRSDAEWTEFSALFRAAAPGRRQPAAKSMKARSSLRLPFRLDHSAGQCRKIFSTGSIRP